MKEQLKDVKHDYIRYANCWEDADILLEGLEINDGDTVFSIGSAGDNSFSLLANNPKIVVAVDINLVQLNLIELKRAAYLALEHQEFLEFLGFREGGSRDAYYLKVREFLPDNLKLFWDARAEDIRCGIIHAGKFERYFKIFRTRVLPFIQTKSRVEELFRKKGPEAQEAFYDNKWNNWRWRLLFRIFFSKFVMGRLGRDPEFLKEVEVSVADFILSQARKHLRSVECQSNYFLHYIMTGEFDEFLPHYARKENYDTIKYNLDRLHTFHGLAEEAFKQYEEFSKFNLSNIFEYMNPELFTTVTENIVNHGTPQARFIYWNLMVPRKMHEVYEQLSPMESKAATLNKEDKGFFYASINCDIKE